MKVCLLGNHGKEQHLGHTLEQHGFEFVTEGFEVLMVDTDHPAAPPAPVKHQFIKDAAVRGVPIVLHPHGAPPDLDMDGLRKSDIPVSLQLVTGEGHAEINRRFGSRRQVEVVGWTFGQLLPETNRPTDHLAFAPIHPWANGIDILPQHRHLNTVAYQAFLDHPAPRKTVRMYGADEPNGVYKRDPGVDYQQSDLGPGLELIDSADAVVSYGTLAYQALARGKPVAMIYPYPPHTSDDGKIMAAHFDEYADYSRYPASVGDAPLDELFATDVAEWKRLFVGGPLDGEKLAWLLNSLRPNRAARRGQRKRTYEVKVG